MIILFKWVYLWVWMPILLHTCFSVVDWSLRTCTWKIIILLLIIFVLLSSLYIFNILQPTFIFSLDNLVLTQLIILTWQLAGVHLSVLIPSASKDAISLITVSTILNMSLQPFSVSLVMSKLLVDFLVLIIHCIFSSNFCSLFVHGILARGRQPWRFFNILSSR